MRTALLLLASLALVLVSCGDSDEDSSAQAEDWCSLATEVEALDFDSIDPFDPEALEVFFDDASSVIGRIRASAPSEIADDVATFADVFESLDEAVRDADFNFLDVDLAAFSEIEGSGDAIEAYNERECGIEADPEDVDEGSNEEDDSGFDPSAGSLRDQLVTQFTAQGFSESEATCLADNLDPTMLDGDESAVLAIFEQCDIDISRLAEVFG